MNSKRLTKYAYGYPTVWTNWMYPPKNVSTYQYFKAFWKGRWYSNNAYFKANYATALPALAIIMYAGFKLRAATMDSPYNVTLKNDKPHWLLGPPDPVYVEKRRVARLMKAPEL